MTSLPPPAGADTGDHHAPGRGLSARHKALIRVFSGVAVLALLSAAGLLVWDATTGAAADPTDQNVASSGDASGAGASDDRIGSAVRGVDLRAGDCINYDITAASIETYEVVSCDTPHVSEVTSLIQHAQAGKEYPGGDAFRLLWPRCEVTSALYVGVEDVRQAALVPTVFNPELFDWEDGMYSVVCHVSRYNGEPIDQSLRDAGDQFPRPPELPVVALAPGDCFDLPAADATAATTDYTAVTWGECTGGQDGLLFGRGYLTRWGTDDPYPGEEEVSAEMLELCEADFEAFFGIEPQGFNLGTFGPRDDSWGVTWTVLCVLIDPEGLPTIPEIASYRPLAEHPDGACFVYPPRVESADLKLVGDLVREVPCSEPHDGELITTGNLPTGAFPGQDSVQATVLELCRDVVLAGLDASTPSSLDVKLVVPSEEGWADADRRYECWIPAAG